MTGANLVFLEISSNADASGGDDDWQGIAFIQHPLFAIRHLLPKLPNLVSSYWKEKTMLDLSIIVPCWENSTDLETTLASLLRHRPANAEIIVAHEDCYDDPYSLSDEIRFLNVREGGSELLNDAWQISTGEIVHFLGCGFEVDDHWAEYALSHFDDVDVGAVGGMATNRNETQIVSAGIDYTTGGARRLLGAGVKLSEKRIAKLNPIGADLAAAFYRRELLEAIGGFDASIGPALADVDMALMLDELEFDQLVEPNCRVFAATPPRVRGSYAAGSGAERIYRSLGEPKLSYRNLVAHPARIAWDFCGDLKNGGAFPRLLGRFTANFARNTGLKRQQRVDQARRELQSYEEANVLSMPTRESQAELRRAA